MLNDKTTWIFELKDLSKDDFKHLQKNFDKMDHQVQGMEKRDAFSASRRGAGKFKDQLQGIRNEIPLLDRGLSLLASPLGIAAAAGVGLFTVLNKSNKAAEEFNHQFLELKNLNLDKTKDQIESLRGSVLGSSYYTGKDASETSTAYFDVQSATGKFGSEVDSIVAKLAKFSTATKADFNRSVEGAAKSIGIFNIKARDLDHFLESSAKTVQVGITTFDQLAKVQVEYAGAAAAANQGFDEANKLFSVFSKNAKSVDIAANLTKTAFQDLTKGSTIKGFHKIGVELFNAKGEMKAVDMIAAELAPKLAKMSDQDFAKFKEAVGGSEGIKALLDQLKASGEGVIQTMKDFDNSEFSLDSAFKNALDDAETLSSIIDNKLNTSMIRLGESSQPMFNFFKSLQLSGIDKLNTLITDFQYLTDDEFAANADRRYSAYKISKQLNFDHEKFEGLPKAKQDQLLEQYRAREADLRTQVKGYPGGGFDGNPDNLREYQGYALGKANFLKKIIDEYSSTGGELLDGSDKTVTTPITGIESTNKVRNVTVNIQNLINEVQHIKNNGEGLSEDEFEEKIVELLVRAVRDAEIAISN